MSLGDLQRKFWECVRSSTPPTANRGFVGRPPLAAARRLGIYHYAYFARQEAVLGELFPRLQAVLGVPRFRELARRFVLERPSTTPVIERIGESFAKFLPESSDALDFTLVDLARLEWASVEALLAPDATHDVSPAALDRIDVDRVRWIAAPSVRLLLVRDGALELWRGRTNTQLTTDAPMRSLFVVITRPSDAVVHSVMSDDAGRALSRLLAGERLGEAFSEFDGGAGVDRAGAALAEFLRLKLFAGWEPIDATP
ncbi:MAG TPA: DNA-binding domain-containing protein [Polyangiaceae bacterium]|nr:DNA-binding domain-containing protein [Polyangiaceae bacterium]